MDYKKLQENIWEKITRPVKAGDWVKGKNFDIGEVLYTDGNMVTVKIVDSPNHEIGNVLGFRITDLTILDTTDAEKEITWKKVKKFQKKVKESVSNIYEDMKYSCSHAHAHLDRMVKLAKDNTSEFADTVRYLKDVLDYLEKINWDKLKKK